MPVSVEMRKKRTFAVHIKNLFCNAEPCKTFSASPLTRLAVYWNALCKFSNTMLILYFFFQAVDPKHRLHIWNASRAQNPQFSEPEASQPWAPRYPAGWLLTPNRERQSVDLTVSCVPSPPLNPARSLLWEHPAPHRYLQRSPTNSRIYSNNSTRK